MAQSGIDYAKIQLCLYVYHSTMAKMSMRQYIAVYNSSLSIKLTTL